MLTAPLLVRASIRLLDAGQGGRSEPVTGSYRPNHNFFGADNREMAVGLVSVPAGTSLAPGQERQLNVQFLSWPDGVGWVPGREWRIQEGAQLVGWGKIVSVV